ncbi:Serine/threonine-protein kinase [Aphelenchoides fujianensis]|nr:Serine/threonine-protein kinase [Aphelenchoides fujianensis]
MNAEEGDRALKTAIATTPTEMRAEDATAEESATLGATQPLQPLAVPQQWAVGLPENSPRRRPAAFVESTQDETSSPRSSPLFAGAPKERAAFPFRLGDTLRMAVDETGEEAAFLITGQLGSGGFSRVFGVCRADDPERQFALKVVRLDAAPALRVQLLAELEVLQRLRGSPHVVELLGSKQVGETLLLLLEAAMEGAFIEFLCDYQKSREDVEHSFLRRFFSQMVEAVRFVHDCSILHCDIKSDNFLMFGEQLRLADFGCATPLGYAVEGVFRIRRTGTRHFMAPEFVRERFASRASDVWALGVTLFDMIHERAPFDGEPDVLQAICTREPPLEHVAEHPELALLLLQLFDPRPEARPSCRQILAHPWMTRRSDQPPAIPFPRTK